MSKHKREKFTAPLDKTRQDKPFVQVGGELTEEQHRGNCAPRTGKANRWGH